ncbi:Mur ligase domain-containing protein [Streptomyces ardesiacus]
MSGLALVARELGAHITDSDAKQTIYTESLAPSGVSGVVVGHDIVNVPEAPAEVVFSSAVRPENIERAEARRKGLGEVHRSGLLTEFTALHETVAVGGAHGKSSTAALLTHVLTSCGKDPSYVVGALLRPPGVHAGAGAGRTLVIEADESDKSLLNYQVHTAVVTNVDLDHVGDSGAYHDISDVAKGLGEFATRAKTTIVSAQAAEHLAPFVSKMTVVRPGLVDGEPMRFCLQGENYEVNQPGEHQLHNAALVVEVALTRGCAPEDIRAALLTFPGLARRFELRGRTAAGARVYDDYAHHPVEWMRPWPPPARSPVAGGSWRCSSRTCSPGHSSSSPSSSTCSRPRTSHGSSPSTQPGKVLRCGRTSPSSSPPMSLTGHRRCRSPRAGRTSPGCCWTR